MLEQRTSGAPSAASPIPRVDALVRAADLVARHGREISAVTVRLPALEAAECERLERACALAAQERGLDVHVDVGATSTTVRFARPEIA